MEIFVLLLFTGILLSCVFLGYSILYALFLGYLIFFSYGLRQGFTGRQLLQMTWAGVSAVKNILFIFALVGMITAIWRDCGTIAFLIYHASKLIEPEVFLLVAFLLCCFISFLTGTALGTAATVGVICMMLAPAMGTSPVLTGGAILSGSYFGDRGSPMSSSALLVSELTRTDIYKNVQNMMRTALIPFFIACCFYLFWGLKQTGVAAASEMQALFAENFQLSWPTVLPALLIILLCLLKIKVRVAMLSSIALGSLISLFVQQTEPGSFLQLLVTGFQAEEPQLAKLLNGGGIISMLRVAAIVSLSSCYAGIFEGTGLLSGIKRQIGDFSKKTSSFVTMFLASVVTGIISCNQTLAIMLTHQICKETQPDPEKMALQLENTIVVMAPLVPWSIAAAALLSAVEAPNEAILFACYLYLIPLWNLFLQREDLKIKTQSAKDGKNA